MRFVRGFEGIREERKNLSFFKVFQSADLSSESMRAFPYNFVSKLPEEDFSNKMLIKAKWGSSWEVGVSKNQRFYYMEKLGWNKFVTDSALGENEFVTFTLKGKMCFDVNIYEHSGKEMITPRTLQTFNSSSQVKKEPEESNYKNEKTGESPGGVKLNVKKRKYEEANTSKKRIKSKTNNVPEFTITIKKSYLKFLMVPRSFEKHMPKVKTFKIHHSNGKDSWEVDCWRKNRLVFSSGYPKMAREYPLMVDDVCTFKLIKPKEFLLVVSRKDKVE